MVQMRLPNGRVTYVTDAYHHFKAVFVNHMVSLGFDGDQALSIMEELDLQEARDHGFGDTTRFATSMAKTYRRLCGLYLRSPDPKVLEEVRYIGMRVFEDVEYVAIPHISMVLEALSQYYTLGVVTHGNEGVQYQKLKDIGILPFFSRVFCVNQKSPEVFEKVLGDCGLSPFDRRHSWFVGNSFGSDVIPAFENGLQVAHLETASWDYDEVSQPGITVSDRYHWVPDLPHLLKIISVPPQY